MHIRLYFVCFLFVFSSCSNNQVSVKNEKEGKLNSTYQLMVSNEKKIALDSETPTRPPYMQIYTDSTGNRLLTFLNSYKNSIYFYDYDNSSYQKKIVYNREGSDAIMRVAGYYIKSPDSIYVYNMPMTEVDLTDSMGKVKNRISLRTNEPDWPDRYPQYWLKTVNPFIRIGNKIYLTGQTFRSLTMSNIMNFKFTACIDMLNNAIDFRYTYPKEIYSDTNWEDGIATQVYPCLSPDGNLIHSFPASHDLYVCELNSNVITKIYGGSNVATAIHSIDYDEPRKTPGELCLVHYVQQDMYGAIIYDNYRKIYYRFLERGIPNATIQMTMKDKLINVIIMNEKFEYLGETTLGTGKEWNWANSFVTEEGLNIEYLDKNDLDENYLIFKILTLKKLS